MPDSRTHKDALMKQLAINKQKNYAKQIFRNKLIGSILVGVLYGSERDKIIDVLEKKCRILSHFSYNQIENERNHRVEGRFYKEFGFAYKIDDHLKRIESQELNAKGYLWFINEESPIFIAGINDIIGMLYDICLFSNYDFIIMTEDFKSGLAVSNSVGYVMDDYNPEEIIYEFEAWGIFEGAFRR